MRYIKLLVLLLAITACGEGLDPDITYPYPEEGVERQFFLNAQLSPAQPSRGEYINWNKGDKTIFRYVYAHPDEPNIADDELTEVFWIELDPEFDEFSFNLGTETQSSPLGMEFYYTRVCFCNSPAFEFTNLQVSGRKLSETEWTVNFNMTATANGQEFSMVDNGTYTLGTFDWD